MIIHLGTSGAVDEVPTARMGEFEKNLVQYMSDSKPEVAEEINTTKQLSDEGKATLEEAAKTIKAQMGLS